MARDLGLPYLPAELATPDAGRRERADRGSAVSGVWWVVLAAVLPVLVPVLGLLGFAAVVGRIGTTRQTPLGAAER